MLVTESNFAAIVRGLANRRILIVDTETTGLHVGRGDRIVGIGVGGFDNGGNIRPFYFPFRHLDGPNLCELRLDQLLTIILSRDLLINHNMKFDTGMLLAERPDTEIPPVLCTQVGMHLLDENRKYRGKGYSLEELGTELFGEEATSQQRVLDRLLTDRLLTKGDICRLPGEEVDPYCCEDVTLAGRLYQHIKTRMELEEMMEVWHGVSDYGTVLARCHLRGIRVDLEHCISLSRDSERNQVRLVQEMADLAGRRIKPTNKQFAAWLGMPSSAADMLETMKNDPRAKLIINYRAYQKANGTYYKRFQRDVDSEGVIHPDFNQTAVITGRLSVPIVHALPKEDEDIEEQIYRVKEVLIPRPGYVFLQADYKTAELRLASWYAGAEKMKEIFNAGLNPHKETATETGIPYGAAKSINFSIIYGIGPDSLSEDLGISYREAVNYLGRHHRLHPEFPIFYKRCDSIAKRRGHIQMHSGRRRHYTAQASYTPTHKASDHLIQGGIGEHLRERQTWVDRELRQCFGVHQILPVHDSALMEVPTDNLEKVIPLVREIMEEHTKFDPPLTIDIEIGRKSFSKSQMEAV